MTEGMQTPSWPVTLSAAGRVVIPKEARELTGWHRGTELILCPNVDGGLEIKSLDQFIAEVQSYFADKFGDRNLVDELIFERREEAALDERNS